MKKTKLPIINIPDEILQEMEEWILARIQGIPQDNITETVSEWAERCRYLSGGLTARAGKINYSVTPFLREPADSLSDMSPIQEVYLMKGTQVGGTVMILEALIGYCIQFSIGPLLYVAGDESMAKETMETKIDEMIANSGLSDKIKPNIIKKSGSRNTGDTSMTKHFGGTILKAIGPNSESKLRSFPMRILLLDEIDIYPQKIVKGTDDTADPIEKAYRRSDSYGALKKVCGISTPKAAETSRIIEKYEDGDCRQYNVKCPGCGTMQPWEWKNLKWDKDKDGNPDVKREFIDDTEVITKDPTYFLCTNEKCGYKMRHKEKRDLLQESGHGGDAAWIPTKKNKKPFTRSYYIPAWLGFRTWIDIVEQFYRVKNDPLKWPTFVNDVQGLPYYASDEKPDGNELMAISAENEQWPRGFIKKEVIYLTLTTDVQKNRIETALVGHGYEKQMWLIDYFVFDGDPSIIEDDCWKKLSMKMEKKYIREDGKEMHVQYAGVDSQYLSSVVDMFCSQFPYDENTMQGVFPLQARDSMDKLVKKFKSNIKTPVLGLSDQAFKRALYTILRKRPLGTGIFPSHYLHISHEFGKEIYEQLTSEEIHIIKINGVVRGHKILNLKSRRNEALDVVKYAMALSEYAEDRYFESMNNHRKSQKLKPIQIDPVLFMTHMEEALFGE